MNTRLLARTLLTLALCAGSLLAFGQQGSSALVIIVNPQSNVSVIDRQQVVNIYMGRYRQLPSGITAIPVDLAPHRGSFYRQLVKKELAEINSYWARLVFSGRASPPLQMGSAAEMLDFVASNRGAIGYIPERDVDDRVRVLISVSEQKP